MTPLAWFGEVQDMDPAAWEAYLKSLRQQVTTAWKGAADARARLKKVREDLNLPFVVDSPTEAGAPGAWNSSYEQNMVELKAIVMLLERYADEAVAGKRPLVFDPQTKQFQIAAIDGDTLRVRANPSGKPIDVVDIASGTAITQFDGELGLAPIAIAAGVASIFVVAIVAYGIVARVSESSESIARSKMLETIETSGAKLVQEGKATPDQVSSMRKALFDGAAAVSTAEAAKSEAEDKWPKTIRTVAFVGLGIAGLWVVGSFLMSRGGGGAGLALARNPAGTAARYVVRVGGKNLSTHRTETQAWDAATAIAEKRGVSAEVWRGRDRIVTVRPSSVVVPWLDSLARNPTGVKLYLERVSLNQGGYDSRGRYWGIGQPLYRAYDDEGNVHEHVRGIDRDDAKAKMRAKYKNATFFRAAS
jgi:hypothetical protein